MSRYLVKEGDPSPNVASLFYHDVKLNKEMFNLTVNNIIESPLSANCAGLDSNHLFSDIRAKYDLDPGENTIDPSNHLEGIVYREICKQAEAHRDFEGQQIILVWRKKPIIIKDKNSLRIHARILLLREDEEIKASSLLNFAG